MILVTGATGKVGLGVVESLRARKASFRLAVRSPQKVSGDAVAFDLDRPETFGPALQGVERLFLLSSGGTEREGPVVDAARKAGVRHVVKLSVTGAGAEAYAIARAHRAIEKKIEASGLAWTFLRPNCYMQNFSTLHAATIREQGAFYAYGHRGKMATVDTRDIGAVAAVALTANAQEGRVYEISGPEALSNDQMAETLTRAIGKPVKFVDLPDGEYEKALLSAGVPAPYAAALVDLSLHIASGGLAGVTPDIESVTGSKPISFERFVNDCATVWR